MQSKQTNSNDRRASYTAPECETCESAHSADEPVLPKRGLLSALRLYVHYLSIAVRSAMQYKTSFFLSILGQFLVSFNVFLGIYFMFRRFSQVGNFSYLEVLICFSIVLLEFSFAEMWARGFDTFSQTVRSGSFDRILVRPQNLVLQVLGSRFELTRLGRIVQAIVLFVYAARSGTIVWTPAKALTVIFMIIGGACLFSGLFLIYAALCFFTLDGLEFINIVTDGAKEYGRYPFNIYGKKVLLFTTFIIPYALVQYYPLLYLLDRKREWYYILVPLLAVLFLLPCRLLWRFGVRHYQSSGS